MVSDYYCSNLIKLLQVGSRTGKWAYTFILNRRFENTFLGLSEQVEAKKNQTIFLFHRELVFFWAM